MNSKTSKDPKPKPKGRLMNQKDIAEEWGMTTRDVLRYVQSGAFPEPVRVTGKKRWFKRSEIAKWMSGTDQAGGDTAKSD